MLGKNIKAFGGALAKADPAATVATIEAEGKVEMDLNGETVEITKEMVDVKISAKEGFAVAMENNVFTILDTTITDELIKEGLARELISKVQQMRKQNDFEMMDNIKIFVEADEEVAAAIEEHKEYIMAETLAVAVENKEGLDTADLNGHKTGIAVERV
jgi:isoleucyl-tRNA synthetase